MDSVPVWHYDGFSAVRQSLRASIADGHLRLDDDTGTISAHRLADLVARGRQGTALVYGLKGHPGWQIGFDETLAPGFAEQLPREARYGGAIDRLGLWPAVALFALLAAGGLYGLGYAPGLVAAMVPRSVERQMGDAMVGDFGGRLCAAPAGRAALDKLAKRIGADPASARIDVAAIPVVNAVTLPGGRIILFEKLIDQAKSAEEVAGVTGHELGHVAHRDVLATLVRQLGLSFVLGGLEGNVRGYSELLLSSAYSRQAETDADGYAIDALQQGKVTPAPTGDFFNRLAVLEGGGTKRPKDGKEAKNGKQDAGGLLQAASILDYLSSHPNSAGRARRFTDAARGHGPFTPLLTDAEWQALRRICTDDPKVKRGF